MNNLGKISGRVPGRISVRTRKKRVFAALLLLAMLLCACSFPSSSSSLTATGGNAVEDRLSAIRRKGVLTVATAPEYFPYEFTASDGSLTGVDVRLAQAIADTLGVKCKLVSVSFDRLLTGVQSGDYDLALAALTATPGRSAILRLSDVYLMPDTEYGLLVRASEADQYSGLLALSGKSVVAENGSVSQALARRLLTESTLYAADSAEAAMNAVLSAQVDACVCPVEDAYAYTAAHTDAAVAVYRFPAQEEIGGLCAAAPPDGTESLMEAVNTCIRSLRESGTLLQWLREAQNTQAKSSTSG